MLCSEIKNQIDKLLKKDELNEKEKNLLQSLQNQYFRNYKYRKSTEDDDLIIELAD